MTVHEKQAGDPAGLISPAATYVDAPTGDAETIWIWELEE
jgi:hypothetical protein